MSMDPEDPIFTEDLEDDDPEASVEDDDDTDPDEEAGEFDLIRAIEAIRELPPDAQAAEVAKYEPDQQEVLREAGVTLPPTLQEEDPTAILSPNNPRYADAIRQAKTDVQQGLAWAKHSDPTTELRGRIEDEVTIINAHPDSHPEYGAALQRLASVLNASQAAALADLPFGRVQRTHAWQDSNGDRVVEEVNTRGIRREVSRLTEAEVEEMREQQADEEATAATPPSESATAEELREWVLNDPGTGRWLKLSADQKERVLRSEAGEG
jgi:hypothetical protein